LVGAAKFLVEATKKSFAVPDFVAVTKPVFSVIPSEEPEEHYTLQNRLVIRKPCEK